MSYFIGVRPCPRHPSACVPARSNTYLTTNNFALLRFFFVFLFFFLTPFCRDKVSRNCFTGQLPGIGTVFILASLQMCKIQRQGPNTKSTDESGWMGGEGGWGLRGLVGVVRGGH